MNFLKKAVIFILIIILVCISGYKLYMMYKEIDVEGDYTAERTSLSTNDGQTVENVTENVDYVSDVLESVTKCVVGISKLSNVGGSILSNAKEDELGLGTGVILTEDGYILSNSHVTGEKYSTCYVTVDDGNTYSGTVVWSEQDLDLSITKINAKNLSFATLGDSSTVRLGEKVYAIGNPIGYEFRRTVTSGIISAKNRTIKIEENDEATYMSDLLQTDATINPGNSGGPLIKLNGEVIGINTVKITSAEGIGFAIPINVVKPIINSFKEKGKYEEVTLGIYAYDEQIIPYIAGKSNFTNGIYVAKIVPNGPASTTDLKEGDIINCVDDKELKTMNDLREYIYTKSPGDVINLKITRGKIKKEILVTLRKK